jgi:hypothetical protein
MAAKGDGVDSLPTIRTQEGVMGTWSEDTFGNDTACDWAAEFLDAPGLEAVSQALDAVLGEDGYLDSDVACEALAACEVVARLLGNWGLRDAYSEELDRWIEENPQPVPPQMVAQAVEAIARIAGDDSELAELWDEEGRNDTWHSTVDDLARRTHGEG